MEDDLDNATVYQKINASRDYLPVSANPTDLQIKIVPVKFQSKRISGLKVFQRIL